MEEILKIIGATANNFKNLHVELPLRNYVSVTGPSGSGKTTLLRDILFGEWTRRITNDLEIPSQQIIGLPPVFYFGNQRPPRSKESILDGLQAKDYLFELALRIAEPRCVKCQEIIAYDPLDTLYSRLKKLIGNTIVIGIPFDEKDILEIEEHSDQRVIFGNLVTRLGSLNSNEITAVQAWALDAITISESSNSRLLELLKHAQELSGSKIIVLQDGKTEGFYLTPTCPSCGNIQRPLNPSLLEAEGIQAAELLNAYLGRNNISYLLSLSLEDFSRELSILGELNGIEKEILSSLQLLVGGAIELGLGYLSLDRRLRTLSSGEFQRVKLAPVLIEQVYGSLIALDEPSSGLSPSDTRNLSRILRSVIEEGNTVLVATHSQELLDSSDEVLELERESSKPPIRFQGAADNYLSSKSKQEIPDFQSRQATSFLQLSEVNLNNLVQLECQIPLAGLTCLFGVSGSGKSTLALQVLLPLVSAMIRERKSEVQTSFGRVSSSELSIGKVVFFRTSRFFSFRRAGVISALGAVPPLRELYLKTELAKIRGLTAKDLNFYSPTVISSEIRFKGVSFNELQELSINDALELFDKIPPLKNKFKSALDLGVGYLKLNQPLKELSAGDEQRLNLAAKVAMLGGVKTLFILDEPLNGLSDEEQISVLKFFRSLVELGHTIVAVDHSPLMLKFCDWKIELGPGAGKDGGRIMDENRK